MPSFQVLVLGFADGFLSPFPDSLPQLFLRCLPRAFAFGLFPSNLLIFRPLLFRFWLLGLCFFLSSFFPFPPNIGSSSVHPSALASLVFPVLPDLISHVFFPGSSYSASCSFPFVPPGFAPTAVPPVLPFCSRFRALPFQSAFFRPLLFRFLLLSLCFFLSSFFPPSPHSGFLGAPSPLSLP